MNPNPPLPPLEFLDFSLYSWKFQTKQSFIPWKFQTKQSFIPWKVQTKQSFNPWKFQTKQSFIPWKFQTKQIFIPRNSTKLCYTYQKFKDLKPRPPEIPHDFFLIIPGNSTCFFYSSPGNSIFSTPLFGFFLE